MTLPDMARQLGLDEAQVRSRQAAGQLISVRVGGDPQPLFPAFQAHPEIDPAIIPMVLRRLGNDPVLAYGFFTAFNGWIGNLSPIEVLLGQTYPDRTVPVDPEAMEFLREPDEVRRESFHHLLQNYCTDADIR